MDLLLLLSSIASLMGAVAIVVASVVQVSMYLPRSGNSDKIMHLSNRVSCFIKWIYKNHFIVLLNLFFYVLGIQLS